MFDFENNKMNIILIVLAVVLIYYFFIYNKSKEGFISKYSEYSYDINDTKNKDVKNTWKSTITDLLLTRLIYTRFALLTMFKRNEDPKIKQLDFSLVLSQNQRELTDLIKHSYDCDISEKLGVLLTEHMILASSILSTIKNDKPLERRKDVEIKRFFDNSQEIYQLLYQFVSGRKDITDIMKMYIDTFVKDIVILSDSHWRSDLGGLEKYLTDCAKISLTYSEYMPQQFSQLSQLL